ncbi:hypothetical protein ILUMI_01712 [Ignelater luminosus]|uniref:Farnesol dehydrogenase-like n=1 Tax=Ignelater luminosus TaxID=2038154 RepID=A0A8K0DJ49_IGNLU|nr:hypothetical protein ILUMI_01712 [Ignelater luminosus]
MMVVSMERWKGKVAVITGASSGIGAAAAEKLVNEGLLVVGIARRKEKLDELREKLKGNFYPYTADITNEKEILQAFKWIKENVGPIHILINNAGLVKKSNLTDGDTAAWKAAFDVNVLALCIATREAIKDMRANNIDGHIIHINSLLAHKVMYIPDMNVYPASKAAVLALVETLRQELNAIGSKIKISNISPGLVKTEFFDAADIFKMNDEVTVFKIFPYIESEDVADAIVYCLSTPPHVQIHQLTVTPFD